MPDEKTEKITKREFSEHIRYLTKEKIDCGLAQLHQLMGASDPEYRFLTIPKVIGVCTGASNEGVQAGAYKRFEPLAIPDITSMEKAREAGRKELTGLLSMFDEPEPVKEIDNTLSKQRLQEAMEKLK